jgi:outer membrane protein OmpA-like peptidoglycan-associated protein
MIASRTGALLAMAASAAVAIACAPKQPRTPTPVSKDATLVVLLPDPNEGAVGRATVSNKSGAVDLANAREATIVSAGNGPSPVTTMSQAEVEKQFGALLSSLPPPPLHFTLYFRFQSDELTPESRSLVPEVSKAVKDRPAPEVVVTGHTDTTGSAANNLELGMKRAIVVRALLIDAGLDPTAIEVTSHGEAVPLVKTPDDTYEPRNRRVEITIR